MAMTKTWSLNLCPLHVKPCLHSTLAVSDPEIFVFRPVPSLALP